MPNVDEALRMIIQARDEASSVLAGLTDKIEQQETAISSLADKLPILSKAVSAGLLAATITTNMFVNRLKELSAQTGISFDRLTKLKEIGDKYRVSLQSVVSVETQLRRIYQERSTTENRRRIRNLQKLGIIKDEKGLVGDLSKVWENLAYRYETATDKSDFLRKAQKDLGLSLYEVAIMLAKGSEAIRDTFRAAAEGGNITEKQKADLEAFNVAFNRLRTAIKNLNTTLGTLGARGFAVLLTALAKGIELFDKLLKWMQPFISTILSMAAKFKILAAVITISVMVAVKLLLAAFVALITVGVVVLIAQFVNLGTLLTALIVPGLMVLTLVSNKATIALKAFVVVLGIAVIIGGKLAIGLMILWESIVKISQALFLLLGMFARFIGLSGEGASSIADWIDKNLSLLNVLGDVEAAIFDVGGVAEKAMGKASAETDKLLGSIKKTKDVFGETMAAMYNLPELMNITPLMDLMKKQEKVVEEGQRAAIKVGVKGEETKDTRISILERVFDFIFEKFNLLFGNLIIKLDALIEKLPGGKMPKLEEVGFGVSAMGAAGGIKGGGALAAGNLLVNAFKDALTQGLRALTMNVNVDVDSEGNINEATKTVTTP